MKTNHAVLEGPRLKHEHIRLINDPIIIQMASEVREGLFNRPIDSEDFDLMLRCSDEYLKRGGKNALTIGGPLKAMLEILTRE